MEGATFLKTNLNQYKEFYLVVIGKDLYCYKDSTKEERILFHSLVHVCLLDDDQLRKEFTKEEETLYPVRLQLSEVKALTLNFKT